MKIRTGRLSNIKADVMGYDSEAEPAIYCERSFWQWQDLETWFFENYQERLPNFYNTWLGCSSLVCSNLLFHVHLIYKP